MRKLVLLALIILGTNLFAQKNVEQFVPALEDNSFFIEEAYNQEKGVVQHISNMLYEDLTEPTLTFNFTQEWPFMSQKHQFSYSIPIKHVKFSDTRSETGLGDIYLNYRYQLTESDDFIAIAPRFSLILPTGDPEKGFGNDVTGFEVNIPASHRISNHFVAHANLGLTYFPGITSKTYNYSYDEATFFGGASLIYLATYNLNFMLEGIFYQNHNKYTTGLTSDRQKFIINPGVRYAFDFEAANLQIVPGLSVPIQFEKLNGQSAFGDKQVNYFFYLSFEHDF